MGHFQAYNAKTDAKVEHTKAPSVKGKEKEGTTSPIAAYYSKILTDALPGRFLQEKQAGEIFNEENFDNALGETWDETEKGKILGYISVENRSNDYFNVLEKIADEENKYYYKWVDSNNEVKDKNNDVILNQLQRVNALVYFKIFFDTVKPQRNKILKHLKKQKLDKKKFLPIAIATIGQGMYYPVYINEEATPLFLDTAEETKSYFYQKNSGPSYQKQRTKKLEKSNGVDGSNTREAAENSEAEDGRYRLSIIELAKKPAFKDKLNGQNERSRIEPYSSQTYPTLVEFTSDVLLKMFKRKHKTSIEEAAKDMARQLPDRYKCFYYEETDVLKGFLSSVNIGEGRSRGGGYAMRADQVSGDYKYGWAINLKDDDENVIVAELLGYKMGLNSLKNLGNTGFVEPLSGLKTTNWPFDKEKKEKDRDEFRFKTEIRGMESLFRYYKSLEKIKPIRNKPDNPTEPRLAQTTPKYADGFKLDNVSYRKWKKGDQLQGEEFDKAISSGIGERLNAGSVMADALSGFQSYENMIKKSDKKVTYSRLPATEFAKYVVNNDGQAKNQWVKDNKQPGEEKAEGKGKENVETVDIITDQEWCHLFGHGDGGTEELGNFVSGSKHCNTEQLAIETGLRRVTLNKDILEAIKKELKAKITAYLMPNDGTYVEKEISDEKLDELLFKKTGIKNGVKEDLKNSFFNQVNGSDDDDDDDDDNDDAENSKGSSTSESRNWELKKLSEVNKSFKNLQDKIKAEKKIQNESTTEALLQFRKNLEENFFLYYPLARWMRYKIYYKDTKIFDHIYDAQSQSFDFNECQILDYTVERAIYKGMQKVNDNLKIKIGKEKEAKQQSEYEPYDYYMLKVIDRVERILPADAVEGEGEGVAGTGGKRKADEISTPNPESEIKALVKKLRANILKRADVNGDDDDQSVDGQDSNSVVDEDGDRNTGRQGESDGDDDDDDDGEISTGGGAEEMDEGEER